MIHPSVVLTLVQFVPLLQGLTSDDWSPYLLFPGITGSALLTSYSAIIWWRGGVRLIAYIGGALVGTTLSALGVFVSSQAADYAVWHAPAGAWPPAMAANIADITLFCWPTGWIVVGIFLLVLDRGGLGVAVRQVVLALLVGTSASLLVLVPAFMLGFSTDDSCCPVDWFMLRWGGLLRFIAFSTVWGLAVAVSIPAVLGAASRRKPNMTASKITQEMA